MVERMIPFHVQFHSALPRDSLSDSICIPVLVKTVPEGYLSPENFWGEDVSVGTVPAIDLLSAEKKGGPVATKISERLSQELVIALVGPVGSGVSTAAQFIHDILTQDYSYRVCPVIKPSDIIKAEMHRVDMAAPSPDPLDTYIDTMQTAGNLLREKFGNNYLSEKVVERICKFRADQGGYRDDVPVPGRRAYIIDSLKNEEELVLLRQIYGDTLLVFGVFAPDQIRLIRLKNAGAAEENVKNIVDRDQGEVATFGQKTRKVFGYSDFFLCNDHLQDELRSKISRFIDLMFDSAVHTPTKAESAMYEASAAAANSACMSRQVGAAIVSPAGELIGVGWNDVPRFGGGLYREDDRWYFDVRYQRVVDKDNRCFKWGGNICHNEMRRISIIDDVVQKIFSSGLVKSGKNREDIRAELLGTGVESLIEFSRSIHAEMEAILSVAREGKHSLVGASLYTSTYPCHNCARHIVAAGIRRVIYIEPYSKSLAIELHYDSISEDPDDTDKVVFRQYDGVAPHVYLRLFRPKADRKERGRLVPKVRAIAIPTFRVPLDGQADYEAKVIADLSSKEDIRPDFDIGI